MILYQEQISSIQAANRELEIAIWSAIKAYEEKTGVKCNIQIFEHSYKTSCKEITDTMVKVESIIK